MTMTAHLKDGPGDDPVSTRSSEQREALRSDLECQLASWQRQLMGAPVVLELPTDQPRPAVQRVNESALRFTIPTSLSRAVAQLSHQHGLTSYITLLAAYAALLSRSTGQEDILVGTPIASRTRSNTGGLAGLFANLLVLRLDL